MVADKLNNGGKAKENAGGNKPKAPGSNNQGRISRKEKKKNRNDELVAEIAGGNNVPKSVKDDIIRLDRELKRLTAKSAESPLMNAGSLLTGPIAEVVHQLCDPGKAKMVAYPGRDPEALVRANFTPFKSIPLINGRSNIITTPYGKYNVFRSNKGNVTVEPTNASLYKAPVTVMTFNPSNSEAPSSYTTVIGQGTTGQHAVFITGKQGTGFTMPIKDTSVDRAQSILFNAVDEMTGCNLSVIVGGVVNNFTIDSPGENCIGYGAHDPGVNCPADLTVDRYHEIPVTAGIHAVDITNIEFTDWVVSNKAQTVRVQWTRFIEGGVVAYLVPFFVSEDINTYLALQVPQIQNLNAGSVNSEGAFIAASTIITSDASSLNNNGFIYGATIAGVPLVQPAYIEFSEWISEQTRWFYKGPLKRGEYQIYVPSQVDLLSKDDLQSSPWFNDEGLFYSMVFIIDNSFSMNGEAPPANTQCHCTWESVYSTAGLGNIIDKVDTVVEPGWMMALALLRRNYNPCANEAHIDAIKSWMGNTLNGLVNYGKQVITSPVTHSAINALVDKGIPLLREFGPGLVSGAATALSML